jgi:hypothetical protein
MIPPASQMKKLRNGRAKVKHSAYFMPEARMKIDFHPEWPKLGNFFKGFKFKPEDYRRMLRRAVLVLSFILIALLLVLAAALILKK